MDSGTFTRYRWAAASCRITLRCLARTCTRLHYLAAALQHHAALPYVHVFSDIPRPSLPSPSCDMI